jgi:hypothetical protein
VYFRQNILLGSHLLKMSVGACRLQGIFMSDTEGEGRMRMFGPEINQVRKKLIKGRYLHRHEDLDFTGNMYEGVTKSFRTSRLERELQGLLLSAPKCGCIAIL